MEAIVILSKLHDTPILYSIIIIAGVIHSGKRRCSLPGKVNVAGEKNQKVQPHEINQQNLNKYLVPDTTSDKTSLHKT